MRSAPPRRRSNARSPEADAAAYRCGMNVPLEGLRTERLHLRASDPALAAPVAAFYRRNRRAHARWNPPHGPEMYSVRGQRERLATIRGAIEGGSFVGWWLFDAAAPDADVALGLIHFSQVSRGPFCSAMLGYAIDQAHEGRGLMREALQAALADAFGARVGLHRVQANVRPENVRSLALLERLGFEREGLARRYLFIDGAWRDHVMTALRHPTWPDSEPPPV
jgi:ribosomal-protein-alanine N-acetyltransferase